jgi:hypothetical protein
MGSDTEGVRPFLTRGAITREAEEELPGHYDPARQVWMVGTDHGQTPIVEAEPDRSELATKTDVRQERDDPGPVSLELSTKTFIMRERDDHHESSLRILRAVETTTKIQGERRDL